MNEIGNIQLKRSHKYYKQAISQIELAKVELSYFVAWKPNVTHYQNVERSISIFLEVISVQKWQDEIDHNSIQCDQCMCWCHYKCWILQLKNSEALGDSWYCLLCLTLEKKWSFPLRISPVNVTKFTRETFNRKFHICVM